jgi:hypothetical protein
VSSIRHYISAFFAGEISPLLLGRVDTPHHAYGLESCENFVPMVEGPIVKRPGYYFIRDADPTASWLTGFRFSITQEYALEWGANKLRFFTNGGRVETAPNVAYELATPYAAADAPTISAQQSYDRQYLDHAAYPPGSIARSSAVTFGYSVSSFTDGPFTDQNSDRTITVGSSAATGSVTLTASSAIFLAGHVGALFKLEALDFSTLRPWEPGMQGITTGMLIRSDGKIYQCQQGNTTGSVIPTHDSGSEWDGLGKNDLVNNKGPYGCQWLFLGERFGTAQITAYTSTTQVTATVIKRLPDSLSSAPSWRWSHAAFSSARGWPSLVVHWIGRQLHFKGFEILASVAGDYLNHTTFTSSGLAPTDLAFRRTLATEDPPLWAAADRQLLAGSASKELAISAINPAQPIGGGNIQSVNQSYYGSEAVFPVQLGTTTVFIERGARRLRAADYEFGRDRYDPIDWTAAARHITEGGVVQLAHQRVPFSMLHAVRGDGQLVTHPLTRDQVKGFCRSVLGGGAQVLSAVSIVGQDGKSDELWLLVSRATPGGMRREVWKQASWRELGDDQRAAFFVDGGVTANASAGQTHFSGLVHLASQAVVVLADGGVISDLTVDGSGGLDLPAGSVPAWPYIMTVGLAYTATAVTLRPEPAGAQSSIQGLRQRVVKVVLRLLETLGLKAGAPGNDPEELLDRPGPATMDQAPPLYSGDTDGAAVECDFTRLGQLRFISDQPLPAIITAATMKLDVDDKDA